MWGRGGQNAAATTKGSNLAGTASAQESFSTVMPRSAVVCHEITTAMGCFAGKPLQDRRT